ncbi:hypothetical protein [Flavobacterium sp.]|uniref:hypothetical protein n=1 Tax=Flavobacterium sp. TaxID=239 RepID=UPI003C4E25B5
MSTVQTLMSLFGKKIICNLFGHKMITSKNITKHVKEYKCKTCQLELTNIENGHTTHLTPELRDINETLFQFNKKRILRLENV